jgi:hypothetical protein
VTFIPSHVFHSASSRSESGLCHSVASISISSYVLLLCHPGRSGGGVSFYFRQGNCGTKQKVNVKCIKMEESARRPTLDLTLESPEKRRAWTDK